MQNTAAGVAVGPAQMADLAVRFVHEYERFGIEHDVAGAGWRGAKLVRQGNTLRTSQAHVFRYDDTS
jgi:hypothetical protein